MGKHKNLVTKWSPVSPMDFPRFESWLEEMAGKGFLVHRVQQNLFSLARVKFRRDEPHPHRRYRVCPAQGQQAGAVCRRGVDLRGGHRPALDHPVPLFHRRSGGPGTLHRPGFLPVRPALSKRQSVAPSVPYCPEPGAEGIHRRHGDGPPAVSPPGHPPGHPSPGPSGPALGPAGAGPGK